MIDFTPINSLERELQKAQSGQSSMLDLLRLFSSSNIFVPSGGEVMPDGSGFLPLLFGKEGVQMVACFSAMERISQLAERAPYCLAMKGGEFLRRIPAGYGLVVNPGQSVGFDVGPEGLKRIVRDIT